MTYKSFQVTTEPETEPVSTSDMKDHLRIDTSTEDTLISSYATTARQVLERMTRRSFITQTITLKFDSFPTKIRLPRPPAISITSIQYVDTDGATQTWSSSEYDVDTSLQPASIEPSYDYDYPDTRKQANAVTVTYTAGYGASSTDVPEGLRLAIKLLAGTFYENREATGVSKITELPLGLQFLVASYEMPEVF